MPIMPVSVPEAVPLEVNIDTPPLTPPSALDDDPLEAESEPPSPFAESPAPISMAPPPAPPVLARSTIDPPSAAALSPLLRARKPPSTSVPPLKPADTSTFPPVPAGADPALSDNAPPGPSIVLDPETISRAPLPPPLTPVRRDISPLVEAEEADSIIMSPLDASRLEPDTILTAPPAEASP
jgi:hypothetical protein